MSVTYQDVSCSIEQGARKTPQWEKTDKFLGLDFTAIFWVSFVLLGGRGGEGGG